MRHWLTVFVHYTQLRLKLRCLSDDAHDVEVRHPVGRSFAVHSLSQSLALLVHHRRNERSQRARRCVSPTHG